MEEKLVTLMREAFYSNVDPRRKQERIDAGMIREDKNAMANLPRQAIAHTFEADEFVEHLKMYDQQLKAKR